MADQLVLLNDAKVAAHEFPEADRGNRTARQAKALRSSHSSQPDQSGKPSESPTIVTYDSTTT